jgi:hypothetical protein
MMKIERNRFAHKIFNKVYTSYLKKKMFLKINEHHTHNPRSSRFTMQRLKLKASNQQHLIYTIKSITDLLLFK